MSEEKVVLSTLYDLNRNAVQQVEKELSDSQVKVMLANAVQNLLANNDGKYALLYSKAKSDFVIFKMNERKWENISKDILECITNRGKVFVINGDEDGNDNSIDIWVKSPIEDAPHLYKFFLCDDWVIEEGIS